MIDDPRYVFIHIPKTAGTSFWRAFQALFGEENVTHHFAAREVAPEMQRFRVLAGHISQADIVQHFPGRLWLTVLREPVDRVLSHYCFQRDHGDATHAGTQQARAHDLDALLSLPLEQTIWLGPNRMVRQLGGHALDTTADLRTALFEAKETLKRCAWVGFQERIDLGSLRSVAGLAALDLPRVRVNEGRTQLADLSPELRQRIGEMNGYDQELYAWARDHFADRSEAWLATAVG